MTREEIAEKLTSFLSHALVRKDIEIDPAADMRDSLGLDSMGAIEFVDMIEEEFDVSIEDEELRSVKTLNDAIDLAEKKLAEM